ncbi:hypothetical protein C9I98_07570 [Photobacterium sanctipauli]|uniref:DNA mismatch repair protein n=2 Tax=Photobacterium sanctipauli TaxID=1342794 RepID=A0A2T3NWQ6_9GAMM|nr:hypothetical protein C9I98_07570 [Photobacterium sanctipauli]
MGKGRKWFIPTWTLVAVGLLLNVISALMTNFYIDDATRQANELVQQQQSNEKLITLIWQQVETVERKREHTLELVALSEMQGDVLPKPILEQVIQDLSYWLPNQNVDISVSSISVLMEQLNSVQVEQRDKINQLYLDNLELIAVHAEKMKSISQLRNLALFLQILGLALVLSRDLSRRDYAHR